MEYHIKMQMMDAEIAFIVLYYPFVEVGTSFSEILTMASPGERHTTHVNRDEINGL